MADDDKQDQPSMDEILSSIRGVDPSVEKDTETEGAVTVVSGEPDGDLGGSGEQQEPSMDEILSSIRRVVSSEEDEKTKNEMDIAPGQSEAKENSFLFLPKLQFQLVLQEYLLKPMKIPTMHLVMDQICLILKIWKDYY